MLRKLSAALSIDSSGSSPRVFPSGAEDAATDGAAAAAAAAAIEAGLNEGACQQPAAAITAEHQAAVQAVVRGASNDADVTVVVHAGSSTSKGCSPPAASPPPHRAQAVELAGLASKGADAEDAAADLPSGGLRLPAVALSASAGSAAAAAAGSARRVTDGGDSPIPARRKRPMRISFADVATVAPAASLEAVKVLPVPPTRPSILGPSVVPHRPSILGPGDRAHRPSMLGPGGAMRRPSILGPMGRPSIAGPGGVPPLLEAPSGRKSLARDSLLGLGLNMFHPDQSSRHLSDASTLSDRKTSVFDLLERKRRKPQARWRAGLNRALQSGSALLTSLLLTIMILYSDSLRQACTPQSADPYFLAFAIFVMAAFTLECSLSILANPRYAKTFYFAVDVISTLSILLDIPPVMDPIIQSANDGNGDAQQRTGLENAAQITAAATRAARLAQVTKWLRLWRIMRLWAFYFKHKQYIIDRRTFFEAELEASSQSRVGEKLTELTIRKVVIMVLLVMFAMPVFDVSVGYYGGPPMLDKGGLSMLHASYGALGNSAAFQASLQVYMQETPYRLGRGHTGWLTDLTVYNQSFLVVPGGVAGLRASEIANFTTETGAGCGGASGVCDVSFATFNVQWDSQLQGWLEIGRTTFIIIILLVGAVWFISDTDRLVLRPLERMVHLVKEVSENPLAKVSELVRGSSDGGGKKRRRRRADGSRADLHGDKALETQILESSIHKICSLLSVGFGEAGAEVIADNIRSGGDLNPMVPGRKVAAIFGFCDIRSFTDATEVLQEDVMEFVNSIAQIVHHEVSLHGGAANKNIGDAFLLVWKLPGSRRETGRASLARSRSQGSGVSRMSRASSSRVSMLVPERDPERREETANVADQALASFIIIQAALKRSAKLKAFCDREDLSRRLPGYQVNMGFGLHVGWAIEGAIGSEHKIDASYLSPHVNMASRLEAATKQYGASILLSDDFVRMLSPPVRALVRQVDCVTVKGSNRPVGLFTYDVDLSGLDSLRCLSMQKTMLRAASSHTSASSVSEDALAAVAAAGGGGGGLPDSRQAAEDGSGGGHQRYETFSSRKYNDEFTEHPDIALTRGADPEFLAKFAAGFDAYRTGDWPAARAALLGTLSSRLDRTGLPLQDGPSATLLRVMAGHNFQAPSHWPGFRELTEK